MQIYILNTFKMAYSNSLPALEQYKMVEENDKQEQSIVKVKD